MHNIPDVLGMKMPAAVRTLDAAGVSYMTETLRPTRGDIENGVLRVIRQINNSDGSVSLTVCEVQDL